MWWLAVGAGLYFFRGKIAQKLAPMLPAITPQQSSYYGHAITLAAGLLYLLPVELVGLGVVKRIAYLTCLWSTIVTCGMTIKANYGMPPMPQTMSMAAIKQMMGTTLQPWLAKAIHSVEFNFLFFALIFVTANPSIIALAILGRRSLWSVCTYCTKNEAAGGRLWLRFKPTWEKLQAKNTEVLHYSAMAEIMLGFWLTASLALPTRQILTCFLYWNYLKTRFQGERSGKQHLQAWMQLGQQIEPLFKVAPFLRKPIDMAKGWFQPPR